MEYNKVRIGNLFDVRLLSEKKYRGSSLQSKGAISGNGAFFSTINKEGVVVGVNHELFVDYTEGGYPCTQKLLFLQNKKESVILSKYVYYYLLANKDRLEKLYLSIDKSLNARLISQLEICYPSISEQYEIIGKLDILFNLIKYSKVSLEYIQLFPPAFYQRMKVASGFLWENAKLGDIAELTIQKATCNVAWNIKIEDNNSLLIGGSIKLLINHISEICDPYVLASALSVKSLYRRLEKEKEVNKVSLYKMRKDIIKIPSVKEQQLIADICKISNQTLKVLSEQIQKLEVLKKYCLSNYLYRRNFGRNISGLDENEMKKYMYMNSSMIDSIQSYDALRKEIYQSLEMGNMIQYFDSSTNSVKIKRR